MENGPRVCLADQLTRSGHDKRELHCSDIHILATTFRPNASRRISPLELFNHIANSHENHYKPDKKVFH